jgi:competence protein ComEC
MTLLYLVAAWVAGVFLASSGSSSPSIWLSLAALLLLLAYTVRRNRRWRYLFLCVALFATGASRSAWTARPLPTNHIANQVDSGYITLTGVIVGDIDERDNHVNLHIQVESFDTDSVSHKSQGVILAQAPRYGDYAYGDRVIVSGQLLTPPEFDDFSYRDYLARRGIHAMIPNAEVTIVAHDQGEPWYAVLYDLKNRAKNTIDRLLPSPQAPLLEGILLGVESGIPEDTREDFNRTGTSHIIAISGTNIVVVIGVLMGILIPIAGKKRAGWITMIGVAFYTVFVGADPAVVRAAIMGGLSIIAAQTGRKAYGLTSLAFSVWLMTLWNPLALWDVGFQLSVAATAGLVLFSRDFTSIARKALLRGFTPDMTRHILHWVVEPITVSLAAQITTTPLILLYFGRLSIISLIANVLIAPAQAYIMVLGWIAVLVGMLWLPLGKPLAWVVWLPLTYTLKIVHGLSQFNWSSMDVNFSSSGAWIFYVLLLAFALIWIQHPEDRSMIFKRIRQRATLYALAVVATITSLLVWASAFSQPDDKLHIYFLDIGQGHAVLIQTPHGAQILVDGGPNPTRLRSTIGDALPFWDHDLDMLIVTQPKNSAIGALPALLKSYEVDTVLTNGQSADSDEYRALIRAWGEAQVISVTAGYRIETGDGVTLEILHPQQTPAEDSEPETEAMVIRVSYGTASFLLVPEISDEAEENMLNEGWYIGSTVLELAAHGKEETNPERFLQAANPQVAVVSLGAGNRSGLPAPTVIEWLQTNTDSHIYRTDRQGTIEFVTDGETLQIYTEN